MGINKVIIMGNISNDLELKQTTNGTSVCSFNVAVNRYLKDPTEKKVDFLTVVAWQAKAEFVSRYFKKGQAIVVVGRLENRDWTDKQGNKRISTEIIAEEISFGGNRESSTEATSSTAGGPPSPTGKANQAYMPSAYTQNSQDFEAIEDTEGLPF